MASVENLPDKTIVDRRKTVRNRDLRKTVQNSRDRLVEQSLTTPKFTAELLKHHANALESSILAVPLLIVLASFAGLAIGFNATIVIWAILASGLYAGMGIVSRRFLDMSEDIDLNRWKNIFFLGHIVLGLSWVLLVWMPCPDCSTEPVILYKAVLLVVAIAATATICYAMPLSIGAAFILPTLAFTFKYASTQSANFIPATAFIFTALLFFTFIALRLNRSTILSFVYQTENNALIAELEMARSISDEARRRAEESNLAKSRFLASMSHELRTPLNAILGFSETIAGEFMGPVGNDVYKEYANDINNSGQHLLNLINEILDLSRVEAGRYEIREEALQITDVVNDCLALVRLKAEQKKLKVEQVYETNLPRVSADERALRQIVLNMLSNAIKFTPPGGNIRVVAGWTQSGGQYITISDDGPGISEEEIPVVLSAFGQGSIAIKSAEQGTGLGLPIVQALLHIHGGKFELRSKLREGTQAIAILPAARVLQELPAEPTNAPRPQRRSSTKATKPESSDTEAA